MKRSLIAIPVLLVLGAFGAYMYYQWQDNKIDKWAFVPPSSILVFEPTNLATFVTADSTDEKLLSNLKSLNEWAALTNMLDSVDNQLGSSKRLKRILNSNDMLISMHQGNKAKIANLYIVEVKDLDHHDYFANLLNYLVTKRGFVKSQRVYQGYQVNEYKNDDSEFAYLFYKHYLIASFTPYLVDDAIRELERLKKDIYSQKNKMSLTTSNPIEGEGRIYFNSSELNTLVKLFVDPIKLEGQNLEWISDMMYLDVLIKEDEIDLSGFSFVDTAAVNYLSTFTGIRGVGFEMKRIIPDRSSLVLHSSFEDVVKWHKGLRNYWREHKPSQLTKIGEIENRYLFSILDFYDFVGQEIGLFVLESKKSFEQEKIFAIQHTDAIRAANFLDELSSASSTDSSFYQETYANRSIGRIEVDELPSRIFGDMYTGFVNSFYFVNNDYIFLGNSQHALEVLIDDLDSENTWHKSMKAHEFLESTNDDANFSVYLKTAGIWNLITGTLNKKWSNFSTDNKMVLKQVEYGAIQFTGVDEKFYTNVILKHPGKLIESQEPKSFEVRGELEMKYPIISKPFAVKNHKDRSLEMMVQDSSFQLSLIGTDQKVKLRIPLKSALTSTIYQLDYYKNGKLQYLFSTGRKVHLLDRTGTYIPGYPVQFNVDSNIKALSLIDYDNSKNYRIMVGTDNSFYYLIDKSGKQLKGWNPMKLTGSPAMPAKHLRVRTVDFMIFLEENGIVHGLSRTAKSKSGFPLDLKGTISSPLHIEKGASPNTTELTALTNNGELIGFNLNGGVVRKEQFVKESPNENFKLVISRDGADYLVIRQGEESVEVYNEQLEELFVLPVPSPNLAFQYYTFGDDNELLIMVDRESLRTYFYDIQGRALQSRPLDSDHEVAVLYHESKGEFEIYSCWENIYSRTILKR
ncbi:MAG: hypothetical protein OCD76_20730 [Reichenbachiella sp.]